jgi:dynein assembly factor 1
MQMLTIINVANTLFRRSITSFRKETISRLPSLLYLDDRPVTKDERKLAEAWKKGGLISEKQARNEINE